MQQKARQNEFKFANWGGRRCGAGRRAKGEKALRHQRRERVTKSTPVLVTLKLCAGLKSLRCDAEHAVVRAARLETAGEEFRIVEYVVLSNHLHLIVEALDTRALSCGMRRFGVLLARRLNKLWGRRGQVVAERYHAHVLRTPTEARNALVYVLQNGRKHGAWTARRPDAYSSGESFEGWREGRSEWAVDLRSSAESRSERPRVRRRLRSCLEAFEAANPRVGADERAAAVRCVEERARLQARSWLLRIGWRRRGLLGLMEGPKTDAERARRARGVARAGDGPRPTVARG
jgi:REP element-mobilizing transposase RayT